VALSTRWYAGGRRCCKPIRVTSRRNGRAVEDIVVDECDSSSGCRDNVVDASELGRVEGARAQRQRRRSARHLVRRRAGCILIAESNIGAVEQ
jgi:hypothetical protein